jgi:hypothetical protein
LDFLFGWFSRSIQDNPAYFQQKTQSFSEAAAPFVEFFRCAPAAPFHSFLHSITMNKTTADITPKGERAP